MGAEPVRCPGAVTRSGRAGTPLPGAGAENQCRRKCHEKAAPRRELQVNDGVNDEPGARDETPAGARPGDVQTLSKNGQWVNRVIGENELSESFTSKEEAVDAGRVLAAQLGTRHTVEETDPTGAITDPDPASDQEP